MTMRDFFLGLLGLQQSKARRPHGTPEELTDRARSLRELRRYDEAIDLLKSIVDEYPGALCVLGNTLRDAGRPQEALAYFKRGVQLADQVGIKENMAAMWLACECMANLGELLWKRGDKLNGIRQLEEAVALWPSVPRDERERQAKSMALSAIYLSLAQKCMSVGAESEGRRWAVKRLECVPDCPEALGICLRGLVEDCAAKGIAVNVTLRPK